jgi:hypothetical protein
MYCHAETYRYIQILAHLEAGAGKVDAPWCVCICLVQLHHLVIHQLQEVHLRRHAPRYRTAHETVLSFSGLKVLGFGKVPTTKVEPNETAWIWPHNCYQMLAWQAETNHHRTQIGGYGV